MSHPEDTVVCPYNMAHSIVASRMQFHLRKCRLQHPEAEKAVCPNNSTHIVNKIELDFHLQTCKDRLTFDKMICKVGTESPYVKQPTYIPDAPKTTSTNEEWGEEEVISSESVLDKLKEASLNKPTLHNKICAPRSERKAHKLSERQRFLQVLDSNSPSVPVQKQEKSAHKEKKSFEKQLEKDDYEKSNSDSDSASGIPETNSFYEKPLETKGFKAKETDRASQLEHNQPFNYNVSRDPRNPWGPARTVETSSFGEIIENAKVESRNSFLAQKPKDENRNNLKSEKPSTQAWGGWPKLSNPSENVTDSFQKMNINEQRDPVNPWKLKNSAANFDGPVNNDFPILPMSGKGRGRRLAK